MKSNVGEKMFGIACEISTVNRLASKKKPCFDVHQIIVFLQLGLSLNQTRSIVYLIFR